MLLDLRVSHYVLCCWICVFYFVFCVVDSRVSLCFVLLDSRVSHCVLCCWINVFHFMFRAAGFTCFTLCFVLLDLRVLLCVLC